MASNVLRKNGFQRKPDQPATCNSSFKSPLLRYAFLIITVSHSELHMISKFSLFSIGFAGNFNYKKVTLPFNSKYLIMLVKNWIIIDENWRQHTCLTNFTQFINMYVDISGKKRSEVVKTSKYIVINYLNRYLFNFWTV